MSFPSGSHLATKGTLALGGVHIRAASPTIIGQTLYLPVVTGTVYAIDDTRSLGS